MLRTDALERKMPGSLDAGRMTSVSTLQGRWLGVEKYSRKAVTAWEDCRSCSHTNVFVHRKNRNCEGLAKIPVREFHNLRCVWQNVALFPCEHSNRKGCMGYL